MLPPGACISGIILSSDKTKLSQFSGDKTAWPVYLTIGNISKGIRRQPSAHATVLIGYLPVLKLNCEPNPNKHWDAKRDQFHQCIENMLAPLTKACEASGVKMPCANSYIHISIFAQG